MLTIEQFNSNANPHRNKLFAGDVMELLRELPDNSVDMVFSDPDYGSGIDYHGMKFMTDKEQYRKWYTELAKESMRVVKADGNIFFANKYSNNAMLYADYLAGAAYTVSDYVWFFNSNIGNSTRNFNNAHRTILHATKSKNNKFFPDQVTIPYATENDKRTKKQIDKKQATGAKTERNAYSWFNIQLVKNFSREKTICKCQFPVKLFDKLLMASTGVNNDVLILFGGSGSEIVHSLDKKRNFFSAEIHPLYCDVISQRLANGGEIPEHYKCIQKVKNKKDGDEAAGA